jgi:hypothetical protein
MEEAAQPERLFSYVETSNQESKRLGRCLTCEANRGSNMLWRVFEIERCFEDACGGQAFSSGKPFIVICSEL